MWIFTPNRAWNACAVSGLSMAPAEMAVRRPASVRAGRQRGQHAEERRHAGKNRDAIPRDPVDELARDVRARADHRRSLQDQRHDEIAETVGVAERNDGEVSVGRRECPSWRRRCGHRRAGARRGRRSPSGASVLPEVTFRHAARVRGACGIKLMPFAVRRNRRGPAAAARVRCSPPRAGRCPAGIAARPRSCSARKNASHSAPFGSWKAIRWPRRNSSELRRRPAERACGQFLGGPFTARGRVDDHGPAAAASRGLQPRCP